MTLMLKEKKTNLLLNWQRPGQSVVWLCPLPRQSKLRREVSHCSSLDGTMPRLPHGVGFPWLCVGVSIRAGPLCPPLRDKEPEGTSHLMSLWGLHGLR